MSRSLPLTLGILTLAACGENATPTQPEIGGAPAPPSALAIAAALNTWTEKASPPLTAYMYGYDLGMAPNAAGQSIVYTFGGTSSDEGGTGQSVLAYNVATNTWTRRSSQVGVWYSNGVGKIGNKLYFSGGYNEHDTPLSFTNQLWAYDYSSDRMIAKAPLPIFSAEGVSGVINGKLYVLPGACSGDRYPNAGVLCRGAHSPLLPLRSGHEHVGDPTTGTPLSPARRRCRDRRQVLCGGRLRWTRLRPHTALDVYDPATNTWRTLAPLPTGGGASGVALGGQFYVVVHGFNGTTPDIRAYTLQPGTNQWKPTAAPDFDWVSDTGDAGRPLPLLYGRRES